MLRRARPAVCPAGPPGRGRCPGPHKAGESRRGGRARGGLSRTHRQHRHQYHQQHQYQQQQQQQWRPPRRWPGPARPLSLLSLRPVNVLGRRAPGMRAPRNTNQFLMREKYQLLHLRSDSVGTESGSDCEMDPLDMDSYLGVLENARGALAEAAAGPGMALGMALGLGPAPGPPPEESQQYFPSEHDVLESQLFMERDFLEFCSSIA